MRCPKCGFISFDSLEQCKKCGKAIGKLIDDLTGTVFDVQAPVFLAIESEEPEPRDDRGGVEPESPEETVDLALEDEPGELVLDDGEGEEPVEPGLTASGSEAVDEELELVGGEDSEPADEAAELVVDEEEVALALDEEEKPPEPAAENVQLDLGDIDISDLAPPEDEPLEEELGLDGGGEGDETGLAGPPPVPGSGGAGLEDLQIDDLDLEAPAPPVTGSKAGGKLMPSVKTGTALDDFEIDLGELIGETEEK